MGAGYKPEDHDGLQDAWAEQNAADEKVARLERRLGEAADKALTYAENYELAIARHRDALRDLANAADAVGVRYFDSDDPSDEVQAMQAATITAREVLRA